MFEKCIKMDLSLSNSVSFSSAMNPSITATSIVWRRSLGANVRQSNRVIRAAVESFDAKLPVQRLTRDYSHSL